MAMIPIPTARFYRRLCLRAETLLRETSRDGNVKNDSKLKTDIESKNINRRDEKKLESKQLIVNDAQF